MLYRKLYMPLLDDSTLEDPSVRTVTVTPEQRDSTLRDIGQAVGGTVGRLGSALSAAGDYTRGVLAGTPGERVTGRELLRSQGLVGDEDNWGNFFAGLATDIATDPLSYVSGPSTALTGAGKALKAAGMADDVARLASKKAIATGDLARGAVPGVVKRTHAALQKTGRNMGGIQSAIDPALVSRPLFGPRTANRYLTLEDAVTYADDPAQALQKLQAAAGGSAAYNALKKQTMAKTFGVGPMLGDASYVGDVLGKGFGDAYANLLDTAGQAARWSYPGRLTAAAFDHRVGGAVDPERQIVNIAKFKAGQDEAGKLLHGHVMELAKLHAAAPEAFTPDGNRRLGRLLEVPEPNWEPSDAQWVRSNTAVRNYITAYKKLMPDILNQSRQYGLPAEQMFDKFGNEYLPRQAHPLLQLPQRTDDTMGRTSTMQLPGGRDTIIELSQDPQVSGPNRALQTPEAAAKYLKQKLTPLIAKHSYVPTAPTQLADDEMLNLARILAGLPADVTQHTPLFGQHPMEMIERYLVGRGERIGANKTLMDSLASFADPRNRNVIPGEERLSLPEAMQALGIEAGAKGEMESRLKQVLGAVPADLNNVSIPKSHVDRLRKASEAFSLDEPSNELSKALDHYTKAWRAAILTWPSRSTRDLYSGAASNWLEGAYDNGAIVAVKQLLANGPTDTTFLRELRAIPRYKGNDGVPLFLADLAQTRLVSGPGALDPGASYAGKTALGHIVGHEPITVTSALQELAPQSGRSWRQYAKDFMTWRSSLAPLAENANPILRAGDKLNSLTDGINRLSGYMALLKKGYSPEAAAAAMKRAHVDYSALSGFEKSFLKNLLPWYSYQSKIFREVVRQLVERPGGRYGAMVKTYNRAQEDAGDEYVPSAMRQAFAAPLPDVLGGTPAPGTRRYLTDVDLPGIDQLNMIETPGTISGALQGTARQIAMQTHPFMRLLVEQATGQDLFTNRPVGDATSPLDAIARSVTGDKSADVPAVVDKLVELAPGLGRPLYMARSLLDTTGDASVASRAAKTAVNALTGVKFRDVTPEYRLSDAARELENSIDPYTREFKQTYIPEDMMPHVPDWALDRMAVARQLAREKKKLKEKSQAPVSSSLFE
ncbi:MAG: hypothetical protein EBR88_00165 [Betaproteobacteria bacterium]|nr:hypothetical protein [Betaproteobacteria bacterium]